MFHHIFFRNDLWLLDPNTDILIMMVPETFFFHLVFRILGGFALGYLLCLGLAWYQSKGGLLPQLKIKSSRTTANKENLS